jgi:hypothetical protein
MVYLEMCDMNMGCCFEGWEYYMLILHCEMATFYTHVHYYIELVKVILCRTEYIMNIMI